MNKNDSFQMSEKLTGIISILTGVLWWVFWYMNPLERQITSYIWVVIVGLLCIFTGGAEILLMSRPAVKPLKNAVLVIRGEKNTGFIYIFALDVLYCGPLPKNVDYEWSKFHMGFPGITLFANLAALGIYLFLSRNTIVTIDTLKLFIISFCIHMVVFSLFFSENEKGNAYIQ